VPPSYGAGSPYAPSAEILVLGGRKVICDGCYLEMDLSSFQGVLSAGNSVRYCDECYRMYTSWKDACLREEERMNKLLLLFIEDSRRHVLLKLVPEDFPARVIPDRAGMGVMRLG